MRGPHLALYRHIRDIAGENDIPLIIRQRDADIRIGTRSVQDQRFNDGNLHIIDDRSLRASNVLIAAVAYFWCFWHLDPLGTRTFSSIAQKPYAPEKTPYQEAKPFFDALRVHHLHNRRSKLSQLSNVTKIPSGSIAVFFQGAHPRVSGSSNVTDL